MNPLMHSMNPVKKARIDKGINPSTLARMSRIALQTVYDHEHGVVANCNPKIIQVLGVSDLDAQLKNWQKEVRALVKLIPVANIQFKDENDNFINDEHPLVTYIERNQCSLTTFSRKLCIPRKSLLLYTRNNQGAMAGIIRSALLDAGLPVADVDKLAILGIEFRDRKTQEL